MTTAHGLIVGKFHPPHAGHDLLVRTASHASLWVSVLVLAHPDEYLDLNDRVAWMREMFADLDNVEVIGGIDPHPIDYNDASVWDLHEDVFRTTLATANEVPVTAVFSSENYGLELARRFHAINVAVDPERRLVDISATRIRSDPVGCWGHLPPAVRGGLCRRAVFVGAESTGTTTLSRALVDHLRARWR